MSNLNKDVHTQIERLLKRRRRAEKRFQIYAWLAVFFGLFWLTVLLADIASRGYSAFQHTYIKLELDLSSRTQDGAGGALITESIRSDYYQQLIRDALGQQFTEVDLPSERRQLYQLISNGAGYRIAELLQGRERSAADASGVWVLVDDSVDLYVKHQDAYGLTERQRGWVDELKQKELIQVRFNEDFFINSDSREPEQAGIRGALIGSLLTLMVTFVLSFPLGVGAAIYLEEYARRSRFTDLIDVSINNLASVPSIIFGLLGLAVFINVFGVPRSTPLVGGLVLTLMTLPTIIIASRSAIQAVPQSLKDAAYSMGASKMQVTLHHVLPLAMPGIITGSIIGMAQALGETAPLLLIGMVAFIVDVPTMISDPSTVLPVQIFLWSENPERAFVERTAGAIMILLFFLLVMHSLAALLRRRMERNR